MRRGRMAKKAHSFQFRSFKNRPVLLSISVKPVGNAINFLQNFRINFEPIPRNVRSGLPKGITIAGAKRHLLEPIFVNMLSNFFKFSESISNRFTEMLGQTLKKRSAQKGETSPFGIFFVNMLWNFFKFSESILNRFSEMLGQTFKKGIFIAGAILQYLKPLFVNMLSDFFKIAESISNRFTEMLGQTFNKRLSL